MRRLPSAWVALVVLAAGSALTSCSSDTEPSSTRQPGPARPGPARHARTGRRLLHLAATAPFTELALNALNALKALARMTGPPLAASG